MSKRVLLPTPGCSWTLCSVAEQEDVTEIEALRLKQRLLANPNDAEALQFFSMLDEWTAARERT